MGHEDLGVAAAVTAWIAGALLKAHMTDSITGQVRTEREYGGALS